MKIVTDEDAIWRALAEPIRREILDLLAVAPRTTGELVSHFDSLCRTGVMKHLAALVSAKPGSRSKDRSFRNQRLRKLLSYRRHH